MKRWLLFKDSIVEASSACLFFFFLVLGRLPLIGAESLFDTIGREVNKIFEQNKNAVVRVRIEHRNGGESFCSGFFINSEGVLVTAPDCQLTDSLFYVDYNAQWHLAKVLGIDERSGVAVLQVEEGSKPFPFLKLAYGQEVLTGTPVVGIGYPYKLPACPSFGLVVGKDCEYLNHFFPTTHYRINTRVNPGQIGGPIINSRGLVVGMITMSVKEEEWSYALPSKAIRKVVDDTTRYGKVRYGWVGVAVTKIGREEAAGQVVVARLFPNTPVSGSGLREGDIVVSINGKKITSLADVMDASFFVSVGQKIPVKVLRDGKPIQFEFLVGERPIDAPSGSTILPNNPEELKKNWSQSLPVSSSPMTAPVEKTNNTH
ncbi:serine protease [Methylacidiphilum sp. Yel]|jgi:serine protease Do|uniref:S1C family serine protease n=1 Tax=Methylacidiphilum sp. Yel TaxID=1847730 RepID=UPI00106A69B9|nr:S1C family serine protease [Methylacidiphilum sp. Yel]TFE69838.1 serine protease [Methylacidiphilum sp. Yel]